MSDFDVKSVREIIDTAFGENGNCPIDFNMMGSVLYILARKLDVLKRQFRVEVTDKLKLQKLSKTATYTVAEIKIHTKAKRHGRRRSKSGKRKLSTKDYSHILPPEHLPSTDKSSSDKRHSEKSDRRSSQKWSGKGAAGSSSTDMFSTDEHFSKRSRSQRRSGGKHSDEMSPDERRRTGTHSDEMSPTERRRAGRYSHEISPPTRRRTEKYEDEMSPAERRRAGRYSHEISPVKQRRAGKYADNMAPADRHRPGKYNDEMSPAERRGAGRHYHEISPTDRRRAGKYDDEMSPTEGRRAGRYSHEMSPADRHRFGKYDDEMSPAERRRAGRYSHEMSPSDRHRVGKYDDEMSPAEQRRAGRYSTESSQADRRKPGKYEDEMSPDERRRAGKNLSPSEAMSSENVFIGKSKARKYADQKSKQGADDGIQKRGVERKRKYGTDLDYNDDDNIEEQHEKIFVVTRTPSGRVIRQPRPDLNLVVTQKEFKALVEKTRALQTKFGITNMLPTELDNLRKPTSMTHPRAALNLSVRLDVAETRLAGMMDILIELASQIPGIDIEAAFDERFLPLGANKNSETADPTTLLSETPGSISRNTRIGTHESSRAHSVFDTTSHSEYDISEDEYGETQSTKDKITQGQLDAALTKIYDGTTIDIQRAAADVFTSIRNLDVDVAKNELKVHKVNKKFEDLYKLHYAIEQFGSRVVDIDQRMTSQTSLYQENLHQMRDDLDIALDTLTEALASPNDDPAAVAKMTEAFKSFQIDLNCTTYMQIEFQEELKQYCKNLKKIMEKIERLRKVKSTRDELVDALRNKLSIKDINGLLTQEEFSAVNSDYNKILRNIDYKVFSKECDWQKAIDELYATKRACADIVQMESLIESLRHSFEMLNLDVNYMFDIVGPIKTSPVTKKLDREGNCLSCGTPATVTPNETDMVLWKEMFPKGTPALESVQLIEENIEGICIPGQPIPHPLDQGSFVCEHDCGDAIYTNNVFELIITELNPALTTSVEQQKVNQVEDHKKSCLCATCTVKKTHTPA